MIIKRSNKSTGIPCAETTSVPRTAHAAVGGKDHNGRKCGLQCSVEVCKALDIQHVNLINEQHTRHQLRNALVNVLVDNLVYLCPKLLSNLGLLGLHHLPHH